METPVKLGIARASLTGFSFCILAKKFELHYVNGYFVIKFNDAEVRAKLNF